MENPSGPAIFLSDIKLILIQMSVPSQRKLWCKMAEFNGVFAWCPDRPSGATRDNFPVESGILEESIPTGGSTRSNVS